MEIPWKSDYEQMIQKFMAEHCAFEYLVSYRFHIKGLNLVDVTLHMPDLGRHLNLTLYANDASTVVAFDVKVSGFAGPAWEAVYKASAEFHDRFCLGNPDYRHWEFTISTLGYSAPMRQSFIGPFKELFPLFFDEK